MAYAGLVIETAVSSATKDSHCIPAYPHATTSTTFNTVFYTERKSSNDEAAGGTISYNVVS